MSFFRQVLFTFIYLILHTIHKKSQLFLEFFFGCLMKTTDGTGQEKQQVISQH